MLRKRNVLLLKTDQQQQPQQQLFSHKKILYAKAKAQNKTRHVEKWMS